MRSSTSIMLTLLVSVQVYAQETKWTPAGLVKELYPIAHLESSWGHNMHHQPHSKGPFYSSYGALGLKAVTGYEAMKMSHKFVAKWSVGVNQTLNIFDKNVFFRLFTTNTQFYNECASVHWNYLRNNTESIEQAVFAWRWGLGAAQKANESNTDVKTDTYVAAYFKR